jgi:hypothetical protein
MSHTPEPWNIVNTDNEYITIYSAGVDVFEIWLNGKDELNEVNAKRIVKCVNDCAGMQNPAEEIQAMRTELEALRTDKARLVAELKIEMESRMFGSDPYSFQRYAILEKLLNDMDGTP